MGAIKEVIFEDPDLPDERDDALAVLEGVKEEVLENENSDDETAAE
jgi:poly(A) polymerase